ESGDELLQVQQDRLVVNWRKGAENETYPRYESVLKRFLKSLEIFQMLLTDEKLGHVLPIHCQVTYINHIVSGKGWDTHADADRVMKTWKSIYSTPFLGRPEDVAFLARYRMGEDFANPVGRLHVNFQPAIRSTDGRAIFVLTLLASGAPISTNTNGIVAFFNMG